MSLVIRVQSQSPTEHFDEEMDSFQVCQLIVVCVYTDTKVESGIATIDNLVVTELIGL